MHARVSTYAGTPDQAEEGIQNFEGLTDALRSLDGFEGAYLCVDRGTGNALSVTLWASADAAHRILAEIAPKVLPYAAQVWRQLESAR
jgi:heme-degrading monooxygenase HmoA